MVPAIPSTSTAMASVIVMTAKMRKFVFGVDDMLLMVMKRTIVDLVLSILDIVYVILQIGKLLVVI